MMTSTSSKQNVHRHPAADCCRRISVLKFFPSNRLQENEAQANNSGIFCYKKKELILHFPE